MDYDGSQMSDTFEIIEGFNELEKCKKKFKLLIADIDKNKKGRINLRTFLKRVNHYSRNSVHSSKNIKYFALEKDRDEFAKDCRS